MRSFERWEYLRRAPRIAWDLAGKGGFSFTFDWMPMEVKRLSIPARLNLLKAGLNLAWRRSRPWSWPINMQIELTSYCNLRCPVCPAGTNTLTRPAQAMDAQFFERLMEEIGPYLLTLALWAWGEPLLHPQLERILAIARKYPAVTILSTNGQNLDHERIQQALRREPPAYLIVAIDGLRDETNATYRRGARLKPALDGVRALADWKESSGSPWPVLHCRFMAMRHNEHELAGLREFATAAGFDMVSIRTLSTVDSLDAAHGELIPATEELRAYASPQENTKRRSSFLCQHAFNYPTVLADGSVVACDQDFNGLHAFGRVSPADSFASIWFSERAAGIRKLIRDEPDKLGFCASCPYSGRETSSCSIAGYALRP